VFYRVTGSAKTKFERQLSAFNFDVSQLPPLRTPLQLLATMRVRVAMKSMKYPRRTSRTTLLSMWDGCYLDKLHSNDDEDCETFFRHIYTSNLGLTLY